MSRALLSAAVVLLAAASGEAQQVNASYTHTPRRSSFSVVATLAGYYGYGSGYGNGSYGAGLSSSRYEPYDAFGYTSDYGWRRIIPRAATPAQPDPIVNVATDSALEEGRRKWRSGDPAAALDAFKGAVASDLKSGLAQIHMAMALLAAGDGRNADKAVRSGVELMSDLGPVAKVALRECFKDSKELAKFTARLDKATDGNGALAAALARLLLGDTSKAATQFGALKDNAAARLALLAK